MRANPGLDGSKPLQAGQNALDPGFEPAVDFVDDGFEQRLFAAEAFAGKTAAIPCGEADLRVNGPKLQLTTIPAGFISYLFPAEMFRYIVSSYFPSRK